MKTKFILSIALAVVVAAGCSDMSYKKTKTGLVYKIFPGGSSKDSIAKSGNVVKFNFTRKFNDSVLYTSVGKMPGYIQLNNDPGINYNPTEIFFFTKKGDSAVTIELVDTILKKGSGSQLPPFAKRGDRLITTIKILDVFKNDSLAMPDYNAEVEKDKPRQENVRKEQIKKEWEELKKSGEMEKGIKSMEEYLATKKITAQKTSDGTFVVVKEKGTGEPAVDGKYLTVKYTGKILETDSVFESNSYAFKMGSGSVIRGWDDGLKLFNKGGKGTLYVPGYLAYGKNPGPGGKPFEALIFDVEVTNISETQAQATLEARAQDSLAKKKKTAN